MKPREYCCCAIPVINVGIYLTLTEQFVLGIVAGTLSIATPSRNCALILSCSSLRPLCSRRCRNSFVCPLDFCRIMLCWCHDSSVGVYWSGPGMHSSRLRPWLLISECRKNLCCSEDTVLYMP